MNLAQAGSERIGHSDDKSAHDSQFAAPRQFEIHLQYLQDLPGKDPLCFQALRGQAEDFRGSGEGGPDYGERYPSARRAAEPRKALRKTAKPAAPGT